jgi:hypothetical protein
MLVHIRNKLSCYFRGSHRDGAEGEGLQGYHVMWSGKYVYEKKKRTKTEGAMLLRNLFLPSEYTYIKQEVTALV